MPVTITMSPYLNFAGNAREAMEYYQGVFGGRLKVSSFADFGMPDMPPEGTMHAELAHDDFTIYASDAMPGAEKTWGGTRNYISFMGDDFAALKAWFDALAADGKVGMPLEKQAWGDTFGLVMDKYGIEWMFNISEPAPVDWQESGEVL